jgi:uncharacterized Zn-finger protein
VSQRCCLLASPFAVAAQCSQTPAVRRCKGCGLGEVTQTCRGHPGRIWLPVSRYGVSAACPFCNLVYCLGKLDGQETVEVRTDRVAGGECLRTIVAGLWRLGGVPSQEWARCRVLRSRRSLA